MAENDVAQPTTEAEAPQPEEQVVANKIFLHIELKAGRFSVTKNFPDDDIYFNGMLECAKEWYREQKMKQAMLRQALAAGAAQDDPALAEVLGNLRGQKGPSVNPTLIRGR